METVNDREQSEERLRELILYIAERSTDDPKFGAVKLNKLLHRCDTSAYRELGRPITGVEYMRQTEGPVPRRLVPVRSDMESRGEIWRWMRPIPGYRPQERIIPRRAAKLELFKGDEIALVDSILREAWGKTGRQMSDESHDEVGWQLASNGETIPYETSLIASVEPVDLGDEPARSSAHSSDL